jgi:dihydrodipicolinate synthase/N-acetylneuraminate lyase
VTRLCASAWACPKEITNEVRNMKPVERGIYPMLYAFFDQRGAIDRQAMQQQVRAAVTSGAHGLAVLGLGTEVNKLSALERRQIVEWVATELDGRLPLSVTVSEPTVQAAVDEARFAQSLGASFIVLQPPPATTVTEEEQILFFGGIADQLDVPVAIQNAPQYLGVGLSLEGITALSSRSPNVSVVKAEGSALFVRRLYEQTQGRLAIFNGRCGLELTDNLRAGCHGMIPGIESVDIQARIYNLMQSGAAADEAEAERLYADILPMIVFMIQSIDSFICYGKRIAARRLGLGTVYDREPALAPDAQGLQWSARLSAGLKPFEI